MVPGRFTVIRDEPFVVFLIGMRVNHWWLLPLWWPVAMAMPRMMAELVADPESGLLGSESYFGRTTLMVQYWRSAEHLQRYAHAKEKAHVPAWRDYVKRITSGAVGVWHETYRVTPGSYECVYVDMPRFGLGNAFELVAAEGPLRTAPGRVAARAAAVAG